MNEKTKGRPKGRSKAKIIVGEWRKKNPKGKKADCVRDTGLSNITVYRWWEIAEAEESYAEYVNSGKKSRPISELWKELDL